MMVKKCVIDADEATVDSAGRIGSKAMNLARLQAAGLPVPRFVVVTDAEACALPQLDAHLSELTEGGRRRLAVRSSFAEEDGELASFAGLLHSYLNVAIEDLAARIEQVRGSAHAPRVTQYRHQNQFAGAAPVCPVVVQTMLSPAVSGVAFGADPLTGDSSVCIVSAVAGSAEALVDGSVDGQSWRLRGAEITSRPDSCGTPLLTDRQVKAIGALTRGAAAILGRAQDVEWAIEDGKLWVVQSRPITALPSAAAAGKRRIWDNANISESYGGITTPMTFSFARSVYAGVYRAFCHLMLVPRVRIQAHEDVFTQMLGLFRGRVYYNLFSWYRLIALLPGYESNRRFMEQMMGVREGMPDEIVGNLAHAGWRGRWRDRVHLAGAIAGLIGRYLMLGRMARRFNVRIDEALGSSTETLQVMEVDELVAEYRRLQRALLGRWDAPLVNDFFTMICFGVLRRWIDRWAGPQGWAHTSQLLGGATAMISAEPAHRIAAMGSSAALIPGAAEILCDADPARVEALLREQPLLREQIKEHIARFGDRCMEELKLEAKTLHEEPAMLWRAIGDAATRQQTSESCSDHDQPQRQRAWQQLSNLLGRRPLRRLLIGALIRRARGHLILRENLRFQRTRVFGRVRRIVTQLGDRLAAHGKLHRAADVFYLEIEELLGYVEGGITCPDLRELARVRQDVFQQYAREPAPPERFETRGAAHWEDASDPCPLSTPAAMQQPESLQGSGCYPGIVRAVARVVRDPAHAQPRPGQILVAERTDPGWVMLFPGAAGVLVQRGSVLSHSATLARELGIPTIVGIAGLLDAVHDGDWVEMNGAAGTVRVIPGIGESAPTIRRSAG